MCNDELILVIFLFQGKGPKKISDSVNNSPMPGLRAEDAKSTSTATVDTSKSGDNLLAADSPRTGQRSVSSCSNSPSSVRVNQVYVDQLRATSKRVEEEEEELNREATNSEDDIDMLDAKTPLLKEKNSTIIVEGSSNSRESSNGNNGSSHRTE